MLKVYNVSQILGPASLIPGLQLVHAQSAASCSMAGAAIAVQLLCRLCRGAALLCTCADGLRCASLGCPPTSVRAEFYVLPARLPFLAPAGQGNQGVQSDCLQARPGGICPCWAALYSPCERPIAHRAGLAGEVCLADGFAIGVTHASKDRATRMCMARCSQA